MNKAVATILGDFSPSELEQLIELLMDFKNRFAPVAQEMMNVARERGLSERIIQASITAECLKLAAHMHIGTTEQFIRAAVGALEDSKVVPRVEVGLQ